MSRLRRYRLSVLQLDALRFVAYHNMQTVTEIARYQDSDRQDAQTRCDALIKRGLIFICDAGPPRRHTVTDLGVAELEMIDAHMMRCSKCDRVQAEGEFREVSGRDLPSTICKACGRLDRAARGGR